MSVIKNSVRFLSAQDGAAKPAKPIARPTKTGDKPRRNQLNQGDGQQSPQALFPPQVYHKQTV